MHPQQQSQRVNGSLMTSQGSKSYLHAHQPSLIGQNDSEMPMRPPAYALQTSGKLTPQSSTPYLKHDEMRQGGGTIGQQMSNQAIQQSSHYSLAPNKQTAPGHVGSVREAMFREQAKSQQQRPLYTDRENSMQTSGMAGFSYSNAMAPRDTHGADMGFMAQSASGLGQIGFGASYAGGMQPGHAQSQSEQFGATSSLRGPGMRAGGASSQSVLLTVNLKALTQTLTKKEQLDDKVERALSVLADEMLEDVVEFACRLAKHRGSNMLHKNDVKLAIEKRYKVKVPSRLHQPTGAAAVANQSASGSSLQNNQVAILPQQPVSTANYKSNLALIKKAQDSSLH